MTNRQAAIAGGGATLFLLVLVVAVALSEMRMAEACGGIENVPRRRGLQACVDPKTGVFYRPRSLAPKPDAITQSLQTYR